MTPLPRQPARRFVAALALIVFATLSVGVTDAAQPTGQTAADPLAAAPRLPALAVPGAPAEGSQRDVFAIGDPAARTALTASARGTHALFASDAARDPLAGTDWWGQRAIADDGAQGDFLGFAVAIDGDTAIVGAYGVTVGTNKEQGEAYIFTRVNGIWTQAATLVADDGQAFDVFGERVAISGSTVAVGAYEASPNQHHSQGAVYVFAESGGQWTQQAKLVADDGVRNDALGWSLAMSGSTIVAGAPFVAIGSNLTQGAAYVFDRTDGVWSQSQKLFDHDGSLGDFFGDAVAIDGDTAVVGADSVAVDGRIVQGAAYVFDRTNGVWNIHPRLLADDGATGDNFGRSVAVSGTRVLVGSPYAAIDGNPFEGAVYVFDATGGTWTQSAKLVAGDGIEDGYFGWSVAIDGPLAAIGASSYNDTDTGTTYIFSESGGNWSQTQELLSNDGTTPVDLFGWSTAVSGTTVLIGEPFATVGDTYGQGAAWFYSPSAVDVIFQNGFDTPAH